MSDKNLLFLHGLMGSAKESDFLKENFKVYAPDLNKLIKSKSELEKFYDKIDTLQFDYAYGYSMGGRIICDYLLKRKRNIKSLYLESSFVGHLNQEQIIERRKLDMQHSKSIKQNFKLFLEKWYSAKLWQLSASQKNDLINEKLKHFKNKSDHDILAAQVTDFSITELAPLVLDQLEELSCKTYYFFGQNDYKYKQIGKEIALKTKNIHTFEIEGAAHNIHRFHPQTIINKLSANKE